MKIAFGILILFFMFTVVTNWHILTKHYPEKVAVFEKESERFFNSFKILK